MRQSRVALSETERATDERRPSSRKEGVQVDVVLVQVVELAISSKWMEKEGKRRKRSHVVPCPPLSSRPLATFRSRSSSGQSSFSCQSFSDPWTRRDTKLVGPLDIKESENVMSSY